MKNKYFYPPLIIYTLESKQTYVRDSSVSLSFTLTKNEKVEYYVRINIHKSIASKFWVESDVNVLCDWTQSHWVLYLPIETSFINLTSGI